MKRILVIGCPGSGKSTFSKELQKILGYDILHLDYIYHIDNNNQISKTELVSKIIDFVTMTDSFIIDGNYTSTLELRLQYADTVFFCQIDSKTCISNVINRLSDSKRDDMAPGFDNSKMDDDFLEYIENFKKTKTPIIEEILTRFPKIKVIHLHDYDEANKVLESLR